MAERHVFGLNRTDRPGVAETAVAVLPTIADVLLLDAVTMAGPEVLAGRSALGRPVRWVHVTETASVAGFVSGGELLLSTGVGWPREADEVERYVAEADAAGVAGLVLELGVRYPSAPRALVDACAKRGIPLVVLHAEARFISITEAVHGRIIADQMNALRARDEIHTLFTQLCLRGSPTDFIVAQLGMVLGSPVVLEDLAHRVVAAETEPVGDDVLAEWERDSRAAHRAREPWSHRDGRGSPAGDLPVSRDPNDWLIVPVEARGTRWGYLVALPGRAHPAGRLNVLEQGAVALALGRLADQDADEWVLQSHRSLLASLLGGRFRSEGELRARFEASGLPITDRRVFGIALDASGLDPARVRDAALRIGAQAIPGRRSGADSDAPGLMLAALSLPVTRAFDDLAVKAFSAQLESGSRASGIALAVGGEGRDIRGLLTSLDEAIELLDAASSVRPPRRGATVTRADSRPLLRLVTALAGDPRLQEHTEQMLRPLIEHDLAHAGDLLDVLAAYAEHPGNRTRAAAESHLSRSVFYQRIALIEELLGADLDDGEMVSALHAALLARRRGLRRR